MALHLSKIDFTTLEGHDLSNPNDEVEVKIEADLGKGTDQSMVEDLAASKDPAAVEVEIKSESPPIKPIIVSSELIVDIMDSDPPAL